MDRILVMSKLSYDPATGDIRWKSRPVSDFKTPVAAKIWNATHAGQPAGTTTHGCIQIYFKGKAYQANRLAYEMATGRKPDGYLKYRDKNPFNLRLSNLVFGLSKRGKPR